MFVIISLTLIIIACTLVFLPTIIAHRRNHPNTLAIFIVNFFFGLTGIGWVIALAWSCSYIKNIANDIAQAELERVKLENELLRQKIAGHRLG